MDSDDENGQAGFKKRRLQNACDGCRKRKIKCDSANMPQNICSNCRAFNVDCTHTNAKKKRGPPKGTPRGKRTIQSIVSSILSSSKPYEIPVDQSAVRQVLIDLASHIRSLEEELAELKKEQSAAARSASERSSHEHDDSPPFWSPVEELTSDLTHMQLDPDDSRHFGQSSSKVLIKDALDIKKEYTGEEVLVPPDQTYSIGTKRLEFWTIYPWQLPPPEKEPPFVFPADDLMKHLIDLYFIHMNLYVPILHRPTFERSVTDGLHHENRQFGGVVLAVCAVGARYSDDPRVFLEGSTNGHSTGWQWIRQIKLLKDSFIAPPSLYDVQLYGIYVIFMQVTSTPQSCWILIGLGVRLAQDVGAHRRKMDSEKITVEGELWKRAFWMLYAMDVFASAFMGRPRALAYEDFDIDLPIECDDEYWEHPDPNLAFKQPPGKPSAISAWILLLKLLDILGMSQRTIYAVRRSRKFVDTKGMSASEFNQQAVAELDSKLNEWIESIPPHLKWDPKRENMDHFHQSVLLHVVYYWIQIQIHRPFVAPGSTTTTFPSLAICANAARSCCHVMEVQRLRGYHLLPNVTLMALFNAAIFLTVNVWRGRRGRSRSELNSAFSDVYKCMNMTRVFESRWQDAGRLYDLMGDLVSVTHLRSSAKRQRDDPEPEAPELAELPENTETVFVEKETRKIAGSNRVLSAALDQPTSEFAEPVVQDASERPFTLPVNSNELGSLPIDASFNWSEGASYPSPYSYAFGPQHSAMLSSPQASVDLSAFDTFQMNSLNPGDSGAGLLQDSISSYSGRLLAQGLSTALGNGGHGIADSYLQQQTMTNPLTTDMNANENSGWDDWGSYMADVDELLRAMNN